MSDAQSDTWDPGTGLRDVSLEILDPLLTHIGYGDPRGPLWFLGMEERLDGDAEKNLRWRLNNVHHPIDTIPHLLDVSVPAATFPRTPTWRIMAKIARLLIDQADNWADYGRAEDYVRERLGVCPGNTFLLDLLPLPAATVAEWPYTDLISTRQEYIDRFIPFRQDLIRANVTAHNPETLICYGRMFWRYYRDIFTGTRFLAHRLLCGKVLVTIESGYWGHTRIVLTPFFVYYQLPTRAMREIPTILNQINPAPDGR